MTTDPLILQYGRRLTRRRSIFITLAVSILVATGIGVTRYGQRLAAWLGALQQYRRVLNGAATTGTLNLTPPAAGEEELPVPSVLYRRIAAWTTRNLSVWYDLRDAIRPRPSSFTGDPGAIFIGRRRASDGVERLVCIGANTMVIESESMLLLRLNVEVFDVGSFRSLAFAPVKATASPDLHAFTPGVYDSFRWLSLDLRFRIFDAITVGPPRVIAADPGSVRFTVTDNGIADEVIIRLQPGDQIDVRRASGKPGRFDDTSQPTTRSAA